MEKIANNICMYKVELMGLAIICIMMFHMAVPVVLGIKPLLQIGVDLFLFLGAFTCARSYLPRHAVYYPVSQLFIRYYKKRVWRVMPPFLAIVYIYIWL